MELAGCHRLPNHSSPLAESGGRGVDLRRSFSVDARLVTVDVV
jgi:hypothetical protein